MGYSCTCILLTWIPSVAPNGYSSSPLPDLCSASLKLLCDVDAHCYTPVSFHLWGGCMLEEDEAIPVCILRFCKVLWEKRCYKNASNHSSSSLIHTPYSSHQKMALSLLVCKDFRALLTAVLYYQDTRGCITKTSVFLQNVLQHIYKDITEIASLIKSYLQLSKWMNKGHFVMNYLCCLKLCWLCYLLIHRIQ